MENATSILMIHCADKKGLIYNITAVIYNHGLNILKNDEFVDKDKNLFYMRTEILGEINHEYLIKSLKTVLGEDVNIRLSYKKKKNIVVLATKEYHCLGDLLIKNSFEDTNANIMAVISNYDKLKSLVEKFNIPFHFIPNNDIDRNAHETEILDVIANYSPDYLVLAKYMRVLSSNFVDKYNDKIINIHHSFLPAFIGANPYKQAFERGVKIIGATAHFVNCNLDEGPIITQDIIRIDHTHSVSDLMIAGHEVEKVVLSKALELVLNDRVFISGNKTIIF